MNELREAAERLLNPTMTATSVEGGNPDWKLDIDYYRVRELANAVLAMHLPDDNEPIDRDWLLSLGFLQDGEGDGMGKKIWEKGVTESNFGDPGIQLLWEDGSLWLEVYAGDGVTLHLHELPNECTRLQVRNLLRALGQQ